MVTTSVPSGFIAMILVGIALPQHFGTRPSESHSSAENIPHYHGWVKIRTLDVLGAVFLLSASVLLVTAVMEANTDFAWSSKAIILMLALSGVSWIAFFAWEWYISTRNGYQEPIFPWRFLSNQAWMGTLLTSFFVGSPFNVMILTIPQRFQVVSDTSVLAAGVRLIPFSLGAAISSALGNLICAKFKTPPVYLLLVGGTLNLVGLVLLSIMPVSPSAFPHSGYVYETVTAAGIGLTFGILVLSTPFLVSARDLAVATGAIIQFRFLGGAIGLSIAGSILNSSLKRNLQSVLSTESLEAMLNNIEIIKTFDPATQDMVRDVFARAYRTQFQVMIGFAAAQLPASALIFKKGKQFVAA
jgi:hypothetical protein